MLLKTGNVGPTRKLKRSWWAIHRQGLLNHKQKENICGSDTGGAHNNFFHLYIRGNNLNFAVFDNELLNNKILIRIFISIIIYVKKEFVRLKKEFVLKRFFSCKKNCFFFKTFKESMEGC